MITMSAAEEMMTGLQPRENDGFGLMPLRFRPGRLKRLLGHREFSVDAEFIEIAGQRMLYRDLQNIVAEDGRIKLELADGRRLELSSGSNSPALASLIRQLVEQAREFSAYKSASAEYNVTASMQLFERVLGFRALPYVWAAEILLKTAVANHFSDVHLEPVNATKARLTFRAAGKVRQSIDIDMYHQQRLLARLKHLAGCHSHISDSAQEGAFRQADFDVRLSTFPTDQGERAALRIITTLAFPDVASLGWQAGQAENWLEILQNNRGLFIISGAVGSGKTTAMYATLSELASNDRGLRVVTIEDPVEARIPGICQASLDSTREKDLAVAFKHLLRQDPDVIALGEIRDSACVKEALQAALSGHLILATFHAGSPGEAIDRIRQMGVEDYLVFSGLRGILHLELKISNSGLQPVVELARYKGDSLQVSK
ncbi:MAG: hypothetical protein GQF41_0358 [Candidatus Rifleibacterium amylolyticum]|nr:MAG: hypothetical protein GQF41_0358 [Candidatus Rifleibacterium amylolyticum]